MNHRPREKNRETTTMPNYRIRKEHGFTLIEILTVVVILSILAAISVPFYARYVQGVKVADLQAQMAAIHNAAKMYRKDYGARPIDVAELIDKGYWRRDSRLMSEWDINMNGDPITEIMAISTGQFRGGAGQVVRLIVRQGDTDQKGGQFTGYGIPSGSIDR
ncbi:MAG: type II secretion system protein [Calditrichaeota bacterium]|nr:type II secretion system protein [Calditrichota bacterium]